MRNNSQSSELFVAAKQKPKEKKYWLNRLGGELVKSAFPFDFPKRAKNKSKPGGKPEMKTFTFDLAGETCAKLIKMSNNSDLRIFVIVISLWKVLLNRYTGSADIIVGAPIYRQEPGGEWLNTVLAIRNRLEEHLSFKQLVLQVGKTIFAAVEHQNYPINVLLDQLGITYSPDQDDFPLFDTAVLMENIHQPEDLQHIRLNMKFFLNRIEKDIRGTVEYNARYYHDTTISRIIDHFNLLLETAVFNPDSRVFHIEILSKEEKECLLKDLNDTKAAFPLDKTVVELFETQVNRVPHQPAVVEPGGEKTITYKELNERSNRLARVLKQKGIKAESIVGVMVDRSIDWVTGIMAVLKAGGAYLPIDPGHPPGRNTFILEDSGASMMLTRAESIESSKDVFKRFSPGAVVILDDEADERDGEDASNLEDVDRTGQLAYVIYISCADGRPAGVMVEHPALTNFIFSMVTAYNNDFSSKDKCLSLTDITIDVSICELFLPLCSGAALVLLADEKLADPEELSKAIVDTAVTFAFIPSVLAAEVNNGIREYVRESNSPAPGSAVVLDKLLIGGEPGMEGSVLQEYRELNHSMQIIHGYGQVETTICATSYTFHSRQHPGVYVPAGKPLGNTKIVISDHRQRLCPVGAAGEIWISGAGLARGYLNRPGLTAEKFDPGRRRQRIYKSGDLGRWWGLKRKEWEVEFLGRVDRQVILNGLRIEPAEIENRLLEHKAIKEAVVVDRESKNLGRYLCAYIVYHIAVETGLVPEPTKPQLIDFLSRQLPPYMIPQFFVPLDSIPLTANGKLDRNILPDPQIQAGEEYVAPVSKHETMVAQIWKEILKRDRVGVNDNFFEAGGNSLGLLKVKSRLKETFAVEIPDIKLLEYPSIRAFCDYLDREVLGTGEGAARAEAAEFDEIDDNRGDKLKLRSQILEEDDETQDL